MRRVRKGEGRGSKGADGIGAAHDEQRGLARRATGGGRRREKRRKEGEVRVKKRASERKEGRESKNSRAHLCC